MKKYVPLFENFTFDDLKKNVGMSHFTKIFRKERNSLTQTENRAAKLIDVKINKVNDYVIFYFQTSGTLKYSDKYIYGMTEPDRDFDIKQNFEEIYIMQLKILNFFEWLDTSSTNITKKDIEDVLEVADIQLFCDCPSYHWQGANYHMSINNASIYPTNIPPKHWDNYHDSDQYLCKHLGGLISSIKFFIPQMRQKIIKQVT